MKKKKFHHPDKKMKREQLRNDNQKLKTENQYRKIDLQIQKTIWGGKKGLNFFVSLQ